MGSASNDTSTRRSAWFSASRMILIATVLFIAAILIVAYPTMRFFSTTLQDTVFTTTEFDANVETEIQLPDNTTNYILGAVVPSMGAPAPSVDVVIRTPEGDEVTYENSNGWASMFGNHYREICKFSAPDSRTILITANTDQSVSFRIFRDQTDVLVANHRKVKPWWFAGSVSLIASLLIVVFVIVRKVIHQDELTLDV